MEHELGRSSLRIVDVLIGLWTKSKIDLNYISNLLKYGVVIESMAST
jgi:hypothetical protein